MKKIILLKPYGWCSGVKLAFKKLNSICKSHPDKQIFIIGDLVHNKKSLDLIKTWNVHFVSIKNTLKFLRKLNDKNCVIVFPAHGCESHILEYAYSKFKYVYELTCPYIKSNISQINKLLKTKKNILFVGIKNHVETKSMLSIDKSIMFINYKSNLNKIKNRNYLINQSTMPIINIKKMIGNNKNIIYIPTTCSMTKLRHRNILSLPCNVDLLIIVGDKTSNNTNVLNELAISKQIKTKLIASKEEIDKKLFLNVNNCYITSGTSTNKKDVDDIIKKIKSYNFI